MLYGNLSVLGLLIMKNKTIAPPDADSADFSIFKFMVMLVPRANYHIGYVIGMDSSLASRPSTSPEGL